MATPVSDIRNLFNQKISLYRELLKCLKQEKNILMKPDVNLLWDISSRKHGLSAKIESVRRVILNTLTDASIHHDMNVVTFRVSKILKLLPEAVSENLKKVHVTLVSIKEEIHQLAKESKRFVEGYLEIINDLIGILANQGNCKAVYGDSSNRVHERTNLFLHKEV